MADRSWWRDGVIYQIYPRSFMDSNGDGIGDLEGIRQRLDHLEWLGVDAIWLSPCFRSPMADFGYDVSDYCDIDPIFGTLEDFDRLLADAHARGIKIVLDWVPNHCSEEHPWFLAARSSREDPKRDWFVWRDPGPNGEPPNNWFSNFGGGAWELDPATGQMYLHTFLKEQPELDWRNPELVAAMHDTLRFWLDRGVDGFRMDVIHRIAKHPDLLDNPPNDSGLEGWIGQQHLHDENHEDVHALLRGIRGVLDEYDDRMAVGEVYLFDPAEVARYYGQGDEQHLAFNFKFMHTPFAAAAFREQIELFTRLVPDGCWPDWVLSSHDAIRHASRHGGEGDARARLAAAMLLTLRGTPFVYYGEELGMRNVEVPLEAMQDPLAHTIAPKLSRDGERTPMLWEDAEGAGFTRGTPWLPVGPEVATRNAARQREDRDSILHLYRDLIHLRRDTPALSRGEMELLDAPEDVLAWTRSAAGSRAVVALNLGSESRRVSLPEGAVLGGVAIRPGASLPERSGAFELGPEEGWVLVLGA